MKQIMKLLGCTLLCACLLANGPVSLAAVNDDWTSDVTVEFDENVDPTKPVDPDNPGVENPDEGDNGTGMAGPLSFDFASDLTFPSNIVSSARQVYNSTTRRPYIQITDNRGTGSGWAVTAQLSEFNQQLEGDPEPIETLQGAIITLSNASPYSANMTLRPPYVEDSVELVSGSDTPVPVISGIPQGGGNEAGGPGTGTWVNRWYPAGIQAGQENPNVTLTVFGGTARVGAHSATITWYITDSI